MILLLCQAELRRRTKEKYVSNHIPQVKPPTTEPKLKPQAQADPKGTAPVLLAIPMPLGESLFAQCDRAE